MKPFAIYGKKPRGSKTSKRDVLENIPVFLQFSNSATSGNIIVYYDKPPYPRICVASGNTYWDCRNKVEAYFSKNSEKIKNGLLNINKAYGVPAEFFDKKAKANNYDIFDNSKDKPNGYKLVTPYHNLQPLYLWVDLETCPTKNVGGKKVADSEKICEDYLKRKKND